MNGTVRHTGLVRLLEIAGAKPGLLILSALLSVAANVCLVIPLWGIYRILKELFLHAPRPDLVDQGLLLFWGGWAFMQKAAKFSTPALGMPNWLFYLPAAIGMLLFGLVALSRLLRALKGKPVAACHASTVTEGAAS